MLVRDLIALLKKFPEEMPVCVPMESDPDCDDAIARVEVMPSLGGDYALAVGHNSSREAGLNVDDYHGKGPFAGG